MSRIEYIRGPLLAHGRELVTPVDFRTAARSNNTFTLPAWMTLSCATTGRTVRTSASTIATGLGANAARARSADGSTWGLSLEHATSNRCHRNDDLSQTWSVGSGSITVAAVTDPSGASTKVSVNDTSGSVASFLLLGSVTVPSTGVYCSSYWAQVLDAKTTALNLNLTGGQALAHTGIDGAFVLADTFSTLTATSGNFVLQPRTVAADIGITLAYGIQLESGKYPTSVILTSGAVVSRAADVCSAPAGLVAQNGYFDETFGVLPNYTQAQQTNDHDLFFLDSNNRVFIQQSTNKIVLRIGGADVVSSALTWSRNQALTVRACHSRKLGRILTVSGATTGNGSATGSIASAITLPATAYINGNASGPEESADLLFFVPARAA